MVLTNFRVSQMDERPLKLAEFIGPLSLQACTMHDDWKNFQAFTGYITGDDTRLKILQGDEAGPGGEGGPKKKKGGKKKKKA